MIRRSWFAITIVLLLVATLASPVALDISSARAQEPTPQSESLSEEPPPDEELPETEAVEPTVEGEGNADATTAPEIVPDTAVEDPEEPPLVDATPGAPAATSATEPFSVADVDPLIATVTETVIIDRSLVGDEEIFSSFSLSEILVISGGTPPYKVDIAALGEEYVDTTLGRFDLWFVGGPSGDPAFAGIDYEPPFWYYFEGEDSITLYVSDSASTPQETAVTISLLVVNNAEDLWVSTLGTMAAMSEVTNEILLSTILDIYGGIAPYSFTIVPNENQHGTAEIADSLLIYTPETGYAGSATITLTIRDSGLTGDLQPREVTIDIPVQVIRSIASIDEFACDGTVTFTVSDGVYYPIVYIFIEIPVTDSDGWETVETVAFHADRFGTGTHTVQLDLRPGNYSNLKARLYAGGVSSGSLTIESCPDGGNPALEPMRTFTIHSVSCDGLVTYSVTGSYSPVDEVLVSVYVGEASDTIATRQPVISLPIPFPGEGTHTAQGYIDQWFWDEMEITQFWVTIKNYSVSDSAPASAHFTECVPVEGDSRRLTITNSLATQDGETTGFNAYWYTDLQVYTIDGGHVPMFDTRIEGSSGIGGNGIWSSTFELRPMIYLVCPHSIVTHPSSPNWWYVTSVVATGTDGPGAPRYSGQPCWIVDLTTSDRTVSFSSTGGFATAVFNWSLVGEAFSDPEETWSLEEIPFEDGSAQVIVAPIPPAGSYSIDPYSGIPTFCPYAHVTNSAGQPVAIDSTIDGIPLEWGTCIDLADLDVGETRIFNVVSTKRDVPENDAPGFSELMHPEPGSVTVESIGCDGIVRISYALDESGYLRLEIGAADGRAVAIGSVYEVVHFGYIEIPAGEGVLEIQFPTVPGAMKGYNASLTNFSEFYSTREVWNCDLTATDDWRQHSYVIANVSCEGLVTWDRNLTQLTASSYYTAAYTRDYPRIVVSDLDTGTVLHSGTLFRPVETAWVLPYLSQNFGRFEHQIPVSLEEYDRVSVWIGVDNAFSEGIVAGSTFELGDCDADEVLADPAVELSATRATVGASVGYTIEGFPAASEVSITWRRPGGSSVDLGSVTTDATGAATGTFPVPATEGGPASRITFAAGDVSITLNFEVAPRIVVTPGSVELGATVGVSLRGYGKQETVRVRWQVDGSWIEVGTVLTSNTGSASTTFTVPVNAPIGPNKVRGDGSSFRQQTNAVTVTAPVTPGATLAVTRATVGASVGYTLEHFPAISEVSISWRRPGGSSVALGSVTTDAAGAAIGTFAVPATEGGTGSTITFSSGAVTVTRSFEVAPRIIVTPGSIERGATVTVSLRGYGKQEAVRIRWQVEDGSWVVLTTVTTSNTGSASVTVPVPAGAPIGPNKVRGDGDRFRQQTNAVVVIS